MASHNINIQSAVVDADIWIYIRGWMSTDTKLKKWPIQDDTFTGSARTSPVALTLNFQRVIAITAYSILTEPSLFVWSDVLAFLPAILFRLASSDMKMLRLPLRLPLITRHFVLELTWLCLGLLFCRCRQAMLVAPTVWDRGLRVLRRTSFE